MHVTNPFKLGGVVEPERFIGRQREMRSLWGRLLQGDGIAVVGEPRIGKSSLLEFVRGADQRTEWLGSDRDRYSFPLFDAHEHATDLTPEAFWIEILTDARRDFEADDASRLIDSCLQQGISGGSLKQLFEELQRLDRKIVILIDELDALVNRPRFRQSNFFPLLRSIVTRKPSVALITASRTEVREMERQLEELEIGKGSPLFNYLTRMPLVPWNRQETEELLARYLAPTGVRFARRERDLIWQASGGHPYLAQCMASCLFLTVGENSDLAVDHARRLFQEQTAPYFAELRDRIAPPAAARSGPPRLFYSYAHEDESLRDELAKHLKLLERQGVLESWHDRSIEPGTEWDQTIAQQLLDAHIILLLVSVDFLASDYIWSRELTVALERHEKGEARVIPIILRPTDWTTAPFNHLQALPRDARPVTDWADRDAAFTSIARALREIASRSA